MSERVSTEQRGSGLTQPTLVPPSQSRLNPKTAPQPSKDKPNRRRCITGGAEHSSLVD